MARWIIAVLFPLLVANALPDPAVTHANQMRTGPGEYREGWFGSGETRLHYVEAGSGPLVLFVHGFPSFWYSWFDQMEALKGRYRVVAIDALGAGLSGRPAGLEPYRVVRLAAQLDQLAQHLAGRHQRFVLVGHDWGAALAYAYAQRYPRRLYGVAGLSAPPYNRFLDLLRSEAEQRRRSQYMPMLKALTPAALQANGTARALALRAYASLADQGALTASETALFANAVGTAEAVDGGINWYRANIPGFDAPESQTHWPPSDPALRVPALLIAGTADRTFVESYIDHAPAWGSEVTVIRMPGVGHWPAIEAPVAVNAALVEFARRTVPDRLGKDERGGGTAAGHGTDRD